MKVVQEHTRDTDSDVGGQDQVIFSTPNKKIPSDRKCP